MKKTKQKILDAALEMFNEKGISAVSSRSISDELSISYGNLCYHFPKKNDIIRRLYFDMQIELNEQFRNMQEEIYGLDFMVKSLRVMLQVLFKYKFIFLDLITITRTFDEIDQHAREQFEGRKELLKEMTNFLIKEGYMKEEKIDGHYNMVIHSLLIIINSYITDAELFLKGSRQEKIDYYLELFYSCVRTSLTKKGLKAFNEVYSFDKGRKIS